MTLTDLFLQPVYLLALLVLPLALGFLVWRGMAREATIKRIGDVETMRSLMSQVSPFRRRLKGVFWLLTLSALIIALARPTWGFASDVISVPDLAVVFAVDVSLSMDAEDIAPSRLGRAKLDLREMIQRLPDPRIGMVLWARNAFYYMPMTDSLQGTEIFTEGISTNAITNQGTNIQSALDVSMTVFDATRPGATVIVLMSDGENLVGDYRELLQTASEREIVIHTIGYGTPAGALIPLYDDEALIDYKMDSNGDLVITRLEEEILEEIAAATGGLYIPVKENTADLSPVISAINQQYNASRADAIRRRPVEQFAIFVALALFILAFEIIIPEARR
jgi:Ca-activated chloride channel homolog